MNEFNFTNRETYLAFRAEWKKEYNDLSNNIRELKAKHTAEVKSNLGGHTVYKLITARKQATAMLLLLADAKVLSAQQWSAARQGEAA